MEGLTGYTDGDTIANEDNLSLNGVLACKMLCRVLVLEVVERGILIEEAFKFPLVALVEVYGHLNGVFRGEVGCQVSLLFGVPLDSFLGFPTLVVVSWLVGGGYYLQVRLLHLSLSSRRGYCGPTNP